MGWWHSSWKRAAGSDELRAWGVTGVQEVGRRGGQLGVGRNAATARRHHASQDSCYSAPTHKPTDVIACDLF